MTSSKSAPCPRCGTPIPAAAADQPCPACLMSGALAPPGVNTETDLVAPGETPLEWKRTIPFKPSEFPSEFGDYRLLGLLGRGGMGAVYEAEQLATGRRVALKMLEQQFDSPDMRSRFLREGRIAASVNHPNSLYVFGAEEIDGTPVITMEIAAGGTLKDALDKCDELPVTDAVDAILDVISGLEAAYAAGVLHRDIKPSNCFVDPDGSVKVGDFGLSVSTLARDDSRITATGVIMGTPAFAPPEQLRGDELDVRADIYSVGATLFTLLTGQAPFGGRNAVHVVTNVINQKPKPLSGLREGIPPGLERVVTRCLAKEPAGRYGNYMALRNALLPFSSQEPEPAPLTVRASAGWIDFLIAFLVPYVPLMLLVGGEEFHVQPIIERTLISGKYYFACIGFALLYFAIAEGIWGAGFGKRLKGLRVVGAGGRRPGIGRALIRILVPILCCEGVRVPLLLAAISISHINDMTTFQVILFFVASFGCPWIPVLLSLTARPDNGFATGWDLASGTRVVVKPEATMRPSVAPAAQPGILDGGSESLGPYHANKELVPGKWIVATDPVLRRQVWLLRRTESVTTLPRRDIARSGRLRWLQKVETADATWDAFEATPGTPFSSLIEDRGHLPWGTLRCWLCDLAAELWAATGDRTLPAELSLDHVWITAQGRAVLLDEAWPTDRAPAKRFPVGDVTGQQRFLNAVAACVDSTSLPLHARPIIQNLENGRFEKLTFLTGTLRGLLDKPAEVSRGIRAGSIFLLPSYIWILVFVGAYRGADWLYEMIGGSVGWLAMATALLVLAGAALVQILELPFRTTVSYAVFRLAVVNGKGQPAGLPQRLRRWAAVWLPLFLPMALVSQLLRTSESIAFSSALVLLLLWIGAAVFAAFHPNRGLHDRLSGVWVVRR